MNPLRNFRHKLASKLNFGKMKKIGEFVSELNIFYVFIAFYAVSFAMFYYLGIQRNQAIVISNTNVNDYLLQLKGSYVSYFYVMICLIFNIFYIYVLRIHRGKKPQVNVLGVRRDKR